MPDELNIGRNPFAPARENASAKRRDGTRRLLVGFATLQTLALIFLSFRVFALESETRSAADAAARAANFAQMRAGAPAAQSGIVAALDDNMLRRIIREELEAHAPAAANAAPTAPAPAPYGAYKTAAETEQAASQIRNEIDAYISRGKMTEADMATVQMKIALLPQAEQRRAMARIVNAINAGKLDAQL